MLEVVELAGHRSQPAHLPEQPLIDFAPRTLVRRIKLSGLATEILQDRAELEDRNRAPTRSLRINDRRHAIVRSDRQEIRIELLALRNVHRLEHIGQAALFEHDRDFETVWRGPVIKLNGLCVLRDLLRGYFRPLGVTPLRNPLLTARHVVLRCANDLPDLVLTIEMRNCREPQISFDCRIVAHNLCELWCIPGCGIETDGPGPRLNATKRK